MWTPQLSHDPLAAFEIEEVRCKDKRRLIFEERMIGTPRELKDERFNGLFRSLKITIDDKIVYVQAPADKTRWKYSDDAREHFFFGKIGKSIYTLELHDSKFLNNEPQK